MTPTMYNDSPMDSAGKLIRLYTDFRALPVNASAYRVVQIIRVNQPILYFPKMRYIRIIKKFKVKLLDCVFCVNV